MGTSPKGTNFPSGQEDTIHNREEIVPPPEGHLKMAPSLSQERSKNMVAPTHFSLALPTPRIALLG